MLKFFRIIIIGSIFINPLTLFGGPTPPPTPPSENPHPPITEQDKKRVAFAELAIQKLLMTRGMEEERPSPTYGSHNPSKKINLNFDESCFKIQNCLLNNPEASAYITKINYQYGILSVIKHTHIIPWSFEKFTIKDKVKKDPSQKEMSQTVDSSMIPELNEDEYMIHTYVLFEDRRDWHHLNVIVTEDKKGNLKLRRFFIIQMPPVHVDFPDGVVC